MPLYSPPTIQQQPISYLFVDAGSLQKCLENTSNKFFRGRPLSIDYAALRAFPHPHDKVFYYDAVPVHKKNGETAEQFAELQSEKNAELDFIYDQNGYHVRSGEMRKRERRNGHEQKMVDVQLAVDMLGYAYRGVVRRITLLTSDLDFKPLVEAVVETGVDIHVLYEHGHTNPALPRAADISTAIDIHTVIRLMTPECRVLNPIPSRIQYALSEARMIIEPHRWEAPNGTEYRIAQEWNMMKGEVGEGYVVRKMINQQQVEDIYFTNLEDGKAFLESEEFMGIGQAILLPSQGPYATK
jgi:uncharacterized LabA/DUF88 family protein